MTTQNACPECGAEMAWEQGEYHCDACQLHYKKVMFCPKCNAELEKLVACGAANYFCNTCNELVSRSQATIEFQRQ
ncbi:DNA ligase [Vibrio sp. HA2012]|uniref:zinc ribbon domain-containing protein n=1 Tax=Vibrio sp. HA2012 TaxID=1971595 RepID=UPI000C2BE4EF|nr:zinc ribbon domain-containing protein [Vibrio sp. HA2012]PJC86222.1 DNA ligase [Vibrio sp. HA2012]